MQIHRWEKRRRGDKQISVVISQPLWCENATTVGVNSVLSLVGGDAVLYKLGCSVGLMIGEGKCSERLNNVKQIHALTC